MQACFDDLHTQLDDLGYPMSPIALAVLRFVSYSTTYLVAF